LATHYIYRIPLINDTRQIWCLSPFAVCFPDGSENSPNDLENSPNGSENSPNGSENSPNGLESSPTGSENSPNGSENSPIGSENSPNDLENSPTGSENSPIGLENSPNYPLSVDNEPKMAKNACFGANLAFLCLTLVCLLTDLVAVMKVVEWVLMKYAV
jgi:hypothetical protein